MDKMICSDCNQEEDTQDGLCMDCYSNLMAEVEASESEAGLSEYQQSEECGHIMRVGAVACSVCAGEI